MGDRYGTPHLQAETPWNDTLAAMFGHRPVRAHLPDPLPPQLLEVLMAAAQSAAASSNLQTWSAFKK